MTSVRSVLLAGFAERRPDALPDGPLGTPRCISMSEPVDGFAVIVCTDIAWDAAPTDSLEWLGPRAVHFDDVVRACTSCNVLPFRFGTAFIDDAAVRDHLAPLAVAIRRELDRLGHLDEYRLSLSIERSDPMASTTGADYLRNRRAETHEAQAHLDDLGDSIRERVVSSHTSESSESRLGLSILCGREQWSDVASVLLESSASVEYEGPLPPYHFVSLDE